MTEVFESEKKKKKKKKEMKQQLSSLVATRLAVVIQRNGPSFQNLGLSNCVLSHRYLDLLTKFNMCTFKV